MPFEHFIAAQAPIYAKVLDQSPLLWLSTNTDVTAQAARPRLGESSPAPENLINRDFQAAAPNETLLTNITEFQIPPGKVYLSPMINGTFVCSSYSSANLLFLSRKALPITEAELRLIAKAAMRGDSSQPVSGNKTPAASGMPKEL